MVNLEQVLNLFRRRAEDASASYRQRVDAISLHNHHKVLEAFRKMRVSDHHFKGGTGYGYGEYGKDTLDQLFARVFGTEDALVRPHIVSGTHAITLCLFGTLRPGDELLSATGTPYDTLQKVIGFPHRTLNSLVEWGVTYRQVELTSEGYLDLQGVVEAVSPRTRMVLIQRSRGYQWRPSIPVASIQELVGAIKAKHPHVVCFVDNCYGELVEEREPTEVGVDLMAGSLIKNPGGGIVPAGGYVVGKTKYVKMAAARLFAPGLGTAVGAWPEGYRQIFQGLFLAPHVVGEALKGAIWTSAFLTSLGFEVSPKPWEPRTDIIQAVRLETPERLVAFCRGLQQGSPVDSHILPEPSGIPGYADQVVMAGGTFIQGSSIELSADGPVRPPYAVYIQGGLSQEYVKLGVLHAVRYLIEQGELQFPDLSI